MQKTNYFDLLEELSLLCTRSVFLVSSSSRSALHKAFSEISEIQILALEKLHELETALFTDFLPPLERQSIAEIAHKLCHVIEQSARFIYQKSLKASTERKTKDTDVCSELAQIIEESIKMLKRIKKPNQTPDIKKFRELLLRSRKASRTFQKRQPYGLLTVCELREELSDCFDKIIEMMLCNI